MDREAAGNAMKDRKYRRGEMLKRADLLKQTPGLVVFVVASSNIEQTYVANGPMVLNSVDEKLATFLSADDHVQFWMADENGRHHVDACWTIRAGRDVRLYEAIEVQ